MTFFERINAMTPTDALLAYLAKGKSVFPVRPDKRPQVPWKIYQTTLATPYEARQWIDRWPDMALGFPTGEHNGFNVLDADTPEAEEWLQANVPATPLMQRTRRGTHRFYRCGAFKVPTLAGIGPVVGIDARGEGGYVICPPSIIDGFKYQWQTDALAPVQEHRVPNLDAMGEEFFAASGSTPSPGGILRPHGAKNTPKTRFYNDDGLVAIGCRDDYLRDLIWREGKTFQGETGCLPDVNDLANRVWVIFCEHTDMSDDIPKYEDCFEKAERFVRRMAAGEIPDDDAEIGDLAAYVEMVR